MSDVSSVLLDSNFRNLCFAKTSLDEFSKLVETHLAGYTQRRRLLDALKEFKGKVEAAETKLKVARNVGKAKQLDTEDENMCKLYDSFDLADKAQALNKVVQAMLDEGQLTAEERPQALENLRTRRDAAKTAGKEKVAEKLDKQMTAVVRAKPHILPVANLAEIHALHKRLEEIRRLEKRPPKTLDDEERERMGTKGDVQAEASSLESRSRMWFENEFEFQPRLSHALAELARTEEDERKRAEEEAIEKQRRAEELALQQKKMEAAKKEEEHHKMLMQKLEAKRQEASLKPQKEITHAKPKEKKRVVKLDPHDLFQAPQKEETPEATPGASPEASDTEPMPAPAPAPAVVTPAPAPAAAPVSQAKAKAAPQQPRPPKPELECRWGAPPPCPGLATEEEDELSDMGGPSLAEAALAPKAVIKQLKQSAVKKEQKMGWRTEPLDFQPPGREAGQDEEDSDDDIRALPATSIEDDVPPSPREPTPAVETASSPAPAPEAPAVAAPVEAEPVAKPKPKPRAPKVALECKWDTAAPAPQDLPEGADEAGPTLAEASLTQAASAKKGPAPQPKKKEKKKFTKVSAAGLGFDCNNPNYA